MDIVGPPGPRSSDLSLALAGAALLRALLRLATRAGGWNLKQKCGENDCFAGVPSHFDPENGPFLGSTCPEMA